MIIITPIILILILSFVAFGKGDSSGFKMIGEAILSIVLFLGVGWIITEAYWLIILIIAAIFILAGTSSNNKNCNGSNTNNTYDYQDKPYESKVEVKPIDNPTSFQSELQQNTKTPQQVKNEQQVKKIEQAKQSANIDYNTIKRELIQQAESGKYTIIDGHKNITFDYKYRYKPSFIGKRSCHTYINKTMFNASGELANKISIFIVDNIYYDAYISEIKRLLSKDGVSIQAGLLHKNTDIMHSLPYYSVGFSESVHNYEFVLRCSVRY